MSLLPGARLGPYEILALLGAGGMGEVWRAKDTRLVLFGRCRCDTPSPGDGARGGRAAEQAHEGGDEIAGAVVSALKVKLLPQAIVAARTATELEPLWVGGKNILGCYLYSTGQLPEARKVLSSALEISPENEYARFFLGVTALLEGNPGEALSGLEPPTTVFRRTMLALALHDLGHDRESQQALDDLIARHGQTSACHVAEVYARRGETDKAFEWLDRAYRQRNTHLAWLKFDPLAAQQERLRESALAADLDEAEVLEPGALRGLGH